MIWSLIRLLLEFYLLALLAWIVLSWVPPSGPGPLTTIRDLLQRLTEPVLTPIRRMMPTVRMGGMGLDLSPLIVLLVIQVLLTVLPA